MKPYLIILGAPGSGKGTQASRIVKSFNYVHLSTGDLLRKEIGSNSPLGKKVSEIVKRGDLVSDEIVLELLSSSLRGQDSCILDGFPRNLKQAMMLTEKLEELGVTYRVFYFTIPLDLLKDRVVNRRVCKDCGEIYNLKTKPLLNDGSCKICGSIAIEQRKDDTDSVVSNRLKVFSETIQPVVDFYKHKGLLLEIDASNDEVKISECVSSILETW